jgi:3',5'-cyclic AMP phosphodiesterase CpdA
LVIHCGNVTHDGLPQSFELATTNLRKIISPKLVIPGPYDLKHLGHSLFQEKIGEFDPVFKGREILVYGINSSKYDEMDGWIGRARLHRLIQKLSKTEEDSAKIVALHHHLLPLPHTREKYPIEDAGDVLKELLNSNVDMILTGHRHVSYAQKIEGTIVINANTLSSRRFQARYGNTFNLIDILSNGAVIVSEITVITGMRRILGIYKIPSPSPN